MCTSYPLDNQLNDLQNDLFLQNNLRIALLENSLLNCNKDAFLDFDKKKYKYLNHNFNYIDFLQEDSKFKLLSKYYIYNRIDQLLYFFIKKGNLNFIENSFRNMFIDLKVNKSTILDENILNKKLNLIFNAFTNVTSMIHFFDQTTRWKTKYVLYISSEKKNVFNATRWLLKDVEKLNKRKLSQNISFALKRTANKYNISYKKFYMHNKFIKDLALEKTIFKSPLIKTHKKIVNVSNI